MEELLHSDLFDAAELVSESDDKDSSLSMTSFGAISSSLSLWKSSSYDEFVDEELQDKGQKIYL